MIDAACQRVLDELTACAPSLAMRHQETLRYWGLETPPLTVAFGEIGHQIVEDIEGFSEEQRESIFRIVENGMRSEIELVGVAVATGLIEGMAAPAFEEPARLQLVLASLGPFSRYHFDAWVGFSNEPTERPPHLN